MSAESMNIRDGLRAQLAYFCDGPGCDCEGLDEDEAHRRKMERWLGGPAWIDSGWPVIATLRDEARMRAVKEYRRLLRERDRLDREHDWLVHG